MFNLQGSEIIIVLLLALVVLGPEKLPEAMRRAGKLYADLRKMSTGFQEEFRAAVDEPMRELRDTANVLRDSADFTKLQDGERDEKPKSAEMAPADPDAVPVDETPTFDTHEPATSPDSKSAPFAESPASLDGASDDTAPPLAATEPGPSPGSKPAPFSYPPRSPQPGPDDTDGADAPPSRSKPFTGNSSAAPRQPIIADHAPSPDEAARHRGDHDTTPSTEEVDTAAASDGWASPTPGTSTAAATPPPLDTTRDDQAEPNT